MNQDVRWKQRFSNYSKALIELESAVELSKVRPLSKLEKLGLIQCFEYTYDLAWKTIKDFLEEEGVIDIISPKDSFQEAFKLGIITEGEIWMQMIRSRNLTSHIYDEEVVNEVVKVIIQIYYSRFQKLYKKFYSLMEGYAIS